MTIKAISEFPQHLIPLSTRRIQTAIPDRGNIFIQCYTMSPSTLLRGYNYHYNLLKIAPGNAKFWMKSKLIEGI